MTAETPPTPPAAPDSPEADAIVAALSRIRGRRGPRRDWHDGQRPGPSGGHGGGWGHGFPGPAHDPFGAEHGRGRGPGARGGFGGPALLRMLGQLAHATSPLSVSELADRIGVDQPRASRLVQQAVDREFAAREADPEDARRTRVRLTPAGERAVHGFRGQQRADASAALAALDTAERAELARLLTKLADAWPEH